MPFAVSINPLILEVNVRFMFQGWTLTLTSHFFVLSLINLIVSPHLPFPMYLTILEMWYLNGYLVFVCFLKNAFYAALEWQT